MIKSLAIMGRLPELAVAELESLYRDASLVRINNEVVGLTIDASDIDFDRLGGSIKLCQLLSEHNELTWKDVEADLITNSEHYLPKLKDKKMQVGISVYGFKVSLSELKQTANKLKNVVKQRPQSIRLVPNLSPALSSAQVFHNNLVRDRGVELIIVKGKHKIYVGKTVAVQNINAYAGRDQARPKRDSKVGMLPPKLAQILINLANPQAGSIVLDPFCGTGVVLQEAYLMRYRVYGTDAEARMIDYTQTNLEWLETKLGKKSDWQLAIADATNYHWKSFDSVVSEVYLGQPFSAFPSKEKLQSTINTCNTVTEKFLKNIYAQLKPGQVLSLALPTWQDIANNKRYHLPLVDSLETLGYNRVSFSLVNAKNLVYFRPDQIVAREIIVITRK